jgi:hypothetical protein
MISDALPVESQRLQTQTVDLNARVQLRIAWTVIRKMCALVPTTSARVVFLMPLEAGLDEVDIRGAEMIFTLAGLAGRGNM